MGDSIIPVDYIRGSVRLHRKCDQADLSRWSSPTAWQHNAFLYEWGAIFGNLLLRRGLNYGIGGMYIEYANVASPGDPFDPPTFTRAPADGVTYYEGLDDSATNDYLRVPLISGTLVPTDAENFPNGNLASFFCMTAGVSGVHGKAFSEASNSLVIGGALVAFVDDADHSRDLILSRFYLLEASQSPKLDSGQIGLEWALTLG
jgi:hypothetical protein